MKHLKIILLFIETFLRGFRPKSNFCIKYIGDLKQPIVYKFDNMEDFLNYLIFINKKKYLIFINKKK